VYNNEKKKYSSYFFLLQIFDLLNLKNLNEADRVAVIAVLPCTIPIFNFEKINDLVMACMNSLMICLNTRSLNFKRFDIIILLLLENVSGVDVQKQAIDQARILMHHLSIRYEKFVQENKSPNPRFFGNTFFCFLKCIL
jgi:hypothetical protein